MASEFGAEWLEATDSTNSEALRQAAAGVRGPAWFAARRQTSGRGRAGRTWCSEEGNLHASLLFTPGCSLEDLPQLSLVAGVALYDAVAELAGRYAVQMEARLKWPNDLLVNGMKAGGILIESTVFGSDIVAVVGIGLNVTVVPKPEGRTATSLARSGIETTVQETLPVVVRHADHWLGEWQNGRGFGNVRAAWMDRSIAAGGIVTVRAGTSVVTGKFEGLDAQGALIVRTGEGDHRRFTFGDVSLGTESGSVTGALGGEEG
jgi:BirA family biotin operon repressor/biotin-[acetyl-CoA-carboxylase] ligase